jgi:hypothetical protein
MARDDDGAPRGRGPFWRVLQLVAGIALFLYALRVLPPMPFDRAGFVLLAALLAAGAMAVTDSVVGLAANLFANLHRGDRS